MTRLFLVFIAFVLLTNSADAQSQVYFTPRSVHETDRLLSGTVCVNSLKISPIRLLTGDLNLSYERIITPSMAVNIRLKYHPLGFIERAIDDFSTDGDNYTFKLANNPQFHAFRVDGEYRFFFRKNKVARGFYVAPYARFQNYAGKIESDYNLTVGEFPVAINSDLKISLNSWGGGVQTGFKWLIGEKVVIDWGFAGLGVDRYNFKVQVSSDNLNNVVDDYTRDLQEVLGIFSSYFAKKLAFNALDNELSSSVPFWLMGWKSSLTVGIAF